MAKGKPSRAFLEALQQEKRRRGDPKPGGGFQTPDWFFKQKQEQGEPAASTTPPPSAPPTPAAPQFKPVTNKGSGFKLTWTHKAIAAGILVLVIVVAYVVGRGRQPEAKPSASTEEPKKTAPQSGALDVADRSSMPKLPPPPMIPANPAANVAPGGLPGAVETNATGRTIGMNYVVIQGYSKDDEKLANEAAAALRAGGIPCSVEHGLVGYPATWHIVVGSTAFPPGKLSTPEYQEYSKKVRAIGDKFAGTAKWKRFEPIAYKWR